MAVRHKSKKAYIWVPLFLCLFILLLPVKSDAAAWLQPKGETLVIANAQPYISCKYWDRHGNLKSGPCFRQFSFNPYVEYGLSSNITLIFNPTFLSYSQAGQNSPFALGYITLGGRVLLKKKDYDALSVQLLYNQPFKSRNFGNNITPSSQYALIMEQSFIDLRILYGTGGKFDPKEYNTWYADAELSYRPYFNGAASEIHVDFMVGWKTLNQRLIFEIQQLNTIGLGNPKNPTQPNYNLFTVMPNVIYWYTPQMAFQVGIKQDFAGQNIGRGTAPFIALWFKF